MIDVKSTKKDWIIISTILVVSVITFFVFISITKNKKGNFAEVWYYPEGILVEVDFANKKVTKIKEQEDAKEIGEYPKIDLEKRTITLLGAEQKNKRYEVVIKYDLEKGTMEIISETSPNNICSNMGVSTGKSLICIPNKIDVRFKLKDGLDIDEEV